MKNILKILFSTILLITVSSLSWGQSNPQVRAESEEYHRLKKEGALDGYQVLPQVYDKKTSVKWTALPKKDTKKPNIGIVPKASGCDCYVEPDATYTLAMPPNDDGSSPAINLPFTFSLYGITTNTIYINKRIIFTQPIYR